MKGSQHKEDENHWPNWSLSFCVCSSFYYSLFSEWGKPSQNFLPHTDSCKETLPGHPDNSEHTWQWKQEEHKLIKSTVKQ